MEKERRGGDGNTNRKSSRACFERGEVYGATRGEQQNFSARQENVARNSFNGGPMGEM